MQKNNGVKKEFLEAQKNEITEYYIYKNISSFIKDPDNRKVLEQIAEDEKRHYDFWQSITGIEAKPRRWQIFLFTFISRVFGVTFGIKLMEKGEDSAQDTYLRLKEFNPEVEKIQQDEEDHEKELISLINEERLKYVSSVVLGLNDALVELTGALAGLTLALQNTRLIAVVGFITGIAAAMSMAASEYLSTKSEETDKSPVKASVYTGLAYILTVLFLIFPYLIFSNIFICLGFVIFNALLIILIFTFYISVAKNLSFKDRFLEMAGLSLSIAILSFIIGLFIRKAFGVDL